MMKGGKSLRFAREIRQGAEAARLNAVPHNQHTVAVGVRHDMERVGSERGQFSMLPPAVRARPASYHSGGAILEYRGRNMRREHGILDRTLVGGGRQAGELHG